MLARRSQSARSHLHKFPRTHRTCSVPLQPLVSLPFTSRSVKKLQDIVIEAEKLPSPCVVRVSAQCSNVNDPQTDAKVCQIRNGRDQAEEDSSTPQIMLEAYH